MRDESTLAPVRVSPSSTQTGPDPLGGALLIGLCLLIFLGLSPLLFGSPEGQRTLMAFCVFGGLMVLLTHSPSVGVSALLIFLSLLGGLRRWLIPLFDWVPNDPLLLACPLIAVVSFVGPLLGRRIAFTDRISRLIVMLLGLMALEIVNPAQGGLSIGLAGALFYIVPMLWFFLGVRLGTPAVLTRLYRMAIAVAVVGALYGLYQTWFGFSDSELMWMRLTGYTALQVGGTTRAISFFTSSAEYGQFVSLGIVLLWAAVIRGNRAALVPIPLLALALFLESSRGPVLSTLAACTALWAVQGRSVASWLPRGTLAAALAVAGLVWSLNEAKQVQFSAQTQDLVSHQVGGLLNPGDASQSTVGLHANMVLDGIVFGFTHPLGLGLGATTLAASKYGGNGGSTEVDFSNMFVSLGVIGGVLFLVLTGAVLALAFRAWQRLRTLETLCLLGLLLLECGEWLNGGQYSIAFLAWFSIGALVRLMPRNQRRLSSTVPTYAAQTAVPRIPGIRDQEGLA